MLTPGIVVQALELLEKLLAFVSSIWLLLPFLREQRLGQLLAHTQQAVPSDNDARGGKVKAIRRLQDIQVRFKRRDLLDGFTGLALLCLSFLCGLVAWIVRAV